ncbi:MAG: electron transfer flavoprotein subunit alpha/FixB family protein [Myxococcales bacterium]|nr:electron transfer flavoprotein subunit alpha/FixB family protein [Myxococcales bacterium]
MSKIIVLAEQQSGKLANATRNAITAAKQLAGLVGGGFDIAVAGAGLDAVAAELSGYGAETVYVVDDAGLAGYTAQASAQALHAAVDASGAEIVVATSTAVGKDRTPRIAARLDAGMASDVIKIEKDGGTLLFSREMYSGNLIGRVKINTDTKVLTVRSTEFGMADKTGGQSAIEKVAVKLSGVRMKFVKLDAVESDRPALTEASVVVSGGRGLKEAENFQKVLEPLADHFNAAIGATRAVVDAGWVPNDWQVGQTGKVVAPQLYIAMGISGAIQHLAGMKGSKTIVAINKDPEAPIFSVADYGLVADLFSAVPELTEKLKAR